MGLLDKVLAYWSIEILVNPTIYVVIAYGLKLSAPLPRIYTLSSRYWVVSILILNKYFLSFISLKLIGVAFQNKLTLPIGSSLGATDF